MKIKSITLENFGPYYGSQHIDLSTDSVSPVVLIYGENMRGKTSLLRAIRWALYGKVLSHEGEELDSRGFANYDARDESPSVTVSVEIVFDEDSNDVWKLWKWWNDGAQKLKCCNHAKARSTSFILCQR
jgi:DNA sulfur modification protein DndD